ncbi:MAG: 3-oxoacyl-acyl-carrier protein reductase [Anaerolineaceae bacterium]|nr:MAG: 3-oxoacyl-acyl-carrier protein reductase [Anaerolineaceae bacterium]
MDLNLKNKTALVTGASRGLGYAVALGLAREGCRVAVNSRDKDKVEAAAKQIAEKTGTKAIGLAGDVTDASLPERLIDEAVRAFGGLDILVTNAGGPPAGAFESFDEATWQKAIDLSFMSHVRLIKAALPHLKQSKAASVLTITSYSVKQPIPNLVLSNSIRAATVGLTKSLALELGGAGIRFNSILPGWTETERVVELMTFRAKQNGTMVEEEIAKQSKDSPLGRMGRPEEFANAAVFLVSPAASYVTGVMLTVDGGMYKGTL